MGWFTGTVQLSMYFENDNILTVFEIDCVELHTAL